MPRLNETRFVAKPIEEAFAYTADFANIENWDPGVAKSDRVDDGAVGVGSKYDLMVRFGPRQAPMTYEITRFEAPNRVVLTGKGDTVDAVDDIQFSEVVGGTKIEYTADLEFKGLMRFLVPFLGGTLRKVGVAALDGLESRLGSLSRQV